MTNRNVQAVKGDASLSHETSVPTLACEGRARNAGWFANSINGRSACLCCWGCVVFFSRVTQSRTAGHRIQGCLRSIACAVPAFCNRKPEVDHDWTVSPHGLPTGSGRPALIRTSAPRVRGALLRSYTSSAAVCCYRNPSTESHYIPIVER